MCMFTSYRLARMSVDAIQRADLPTGMSSPTSLRTVTDRHAVIKERPDLKFIVVVNPHNGPGGSPLPDANYTREIPLLNSYNNVQTLGYVATGYAKRDLQAIKNDIHTYSYWSTNVDVQNLKVEGIFFDETPGEYDAASANLLHEIQSEARLAYGFGSRCMLINNPGIIPDARLLHGPNITVVFEGTYATYQQHRVCSKLSKLKQKPERSGNSVIRNHLACIMHSVPVEVADNESAMQKVVRELQRLAGTVYVTDLHEDYYAGFGSGWMRFVDVAS
ncbi:hypothetical protein V493_03707, partial [Pseudogymnoascus sp. VKM F-4281 (FW-2241)]